MGTWSIASGTPKSAGTSLEIESSGNCGTVSYLSLDFA
jgi:hypothetical protein